jgi:hypothetical protein
MMSGSRFDSWSRRRVGALIGGLAVSGNGLISTEAKKKHKHKKKKRCKRLGDTCTPGGKRKCCKSVACTMNEGGVTRCCRDFGEPCGKDSDCCSFNCDAENTCGPLV